MMERDRAGMEPEPRVGDLIEGVTRKLVTAIVIAGGLIGLGAWSSKPSSRSARYQIVATEGRVYRLNTESGWVIGCDGNRCGIVLRSGRDVEDELPALPQLPQQPQIAPPQPAPAATTPPTAAPRPAAPAAAPAPATR